MKFSQRKGLKPVVKVIQKESMDVDLRNSLWNVLDILIWNDDSFDRQPYSRHGYESITRHIWFNYFKVPIDQRAVYSAAIVRQIREYFFDCQWYEVYDFIESLLNYLQRDDVNNAINQVLERELAGYRYVGGVITDIVDEHEIAALEAALVDQDFPSVRAHLQAALRLLSDRKAPDYRNSIKESISAVESLSKAITGKPKATLGEALGELKRKGKIHPALKDAFSKLYGYASDADGIRHAMLDIPDLSAADARFFLVSCSAFINYVKAKL